MSDSERNHGRYRPLEKTHRLVAEELAGRHPPEPPAPATAREEPEAKPDIDAFLEKIEVRQRELDELVAQGRISESEKIYRLNQFDREVSSEIERAFPLPPTDRQVGESEGNASAAEPAAQSTEQGSDLPERQEEVGRADTGEPVPDKRIEREEEAAAYEIVGRGEMTDARAARLARLQSIRETIEERERREHDGNDTGMGRDPGERSRSEPP